jgi:1,4-dihydroxy-2-naphthoyl-CoA synthase
MSAHILVSQVEHVLEVTISRASGKNAMTGEMYTALEAAFRKAQGEPAVHVVLIKGEDGVFCAGNDIDDFVTSPPVKPDAPVWRFLTALMELNKPLVAAVDGPAIGIGTTMQCFIATSPSPRRVRYSSFLSRDSESHRKVRRRSCGPYSPDVCGQASCFCSGGRSKLRVPKY